MLPGGLTCSGVSSSLGRSSKSNSLPNGSKVSALVSKMEILQPPCLHQSKSNGNTNTNNNTTRHSLSLSPAAAHFSSLPRYPANVHSNKKPSTSSSSLPSHSLPWGQSLLSFVQASRRMSSSTTASSSSSSSIQTSKSSSSSSSSSVQKFPEWTPGPTEYTPPETKWGQYDPKTLPSSGDMDSLSVRDLLNLGRELSQDQEEDMRMKAAEEWRRVHLRKKKILEDRKNLFLGKTQSESEDTDFELQELPQVKNVIPFGDASLASRHRKLDKFGRATATGTRKSATALVSIRPGNGDITVNGVPHYRYFPNYEQRYVFFEVLHRIGSYTYFDVTVRCRGGGLNAQAKAVRLGLAKALCLFNPDFREYLMNGEDNMLYRDPRNVKRKLYGRKKHRKRFQWVKR